MAEPRPYSRPTHYAASPELKALYAGECQSCGMCCIAYATKPFGIPVAPEPYDQPPKRVVQIGPQTVVNFTNRFLRIIPDKHWKHFNRCTALVGVQGRNVSCSIYSERPYACSNYDPGSPDCLRVRKWAGLEPLDDGYGRS